jgi:acetyl esterase/lipase
MQVDFKGFPPTLIVAGGAEILYDQIVTLKEKMVNDIGDSATGGKVTFFEQEDAVHMFSAFGWQEPERSEGWKAIANWLRTT